MPLPAMRHQLRRLPSANTVAAGATSTFQIPLGPTYRSFELRPTIAGADATEAEMRAQIERVRVKINGIARIDVAGTRLLDLYEYYGFTIDAGVFPILLTRPYARTPEGEENVAVGTNNVDTLTVEIDLAAGATIDALPMDAWMTLERRDLGIIFEVRENSFVASGAGQLEIPTLPKSNGDLAALHLFSANITALQILIDSAVHFDGDIETMHNVLKRVSRVPVTNVVHFEATALDRLNDALPLANVQDFRQKLTMSGAGTVVAVVETINLPIRPAARAAA